MAGAGRTMTERPQSLHFTAIKTIRCAVFELFGIWDAGAQTAEEPEIVPGERSDFRLLTGLHTVLT
jgi:hypothetical protein